MDEVTRSTPVDAVNSAIEAAKLTQTRIADALGITQPAVSRRMRGEVEWSISELRTLAPLVDTPLVVLLGEAPAGRSA